MVICDIHGDSKEATILTLRSDDGVVELLDRLDGDRDEVAAANIEELEGIIDDVVYDMFGITPAEQNVIEEFLETFRVY